MTYTHMGYQIEIVDGGAEVSETPGISTFVEGEFNQTNIDTAVAKYEEYLSNINVELAMYELENQKYVH